MSEHGAPATALRTGLILLVFTLAFTALMAATYRATRDTIAASVEEEKMKLIREVLPAEAYDNALLEDHLALPAEPVLGLGAPSRLYRARKAGAPAALVLEAIAPDGYGGAIRLIVAVGESGRIAGVRVTSHRETPGLGDYIDIRKDRNKTRPWIRQFDDLGFEQVARSRWKVKKDGGHFDFMTGATISARAVAGAAGRALEFAVANRDRLYAAPAGSSFEPAPTAQRP